MAINWTNEYEAQPVGASNPGFISQSVRTLKTGVRERMTLEHFFGSTESTSYGQHREGSARAYLLDEDTAAGVRADAVSSGAVLPGRIEVDMTVLTSTDIPETDGVDVTDTDQLRDRKISVWDKDDTKITVFEWNEVVHREWDLDITGRKRYTSENPEVQEALDDTTYDAMDAPTQARADEKAVKRSGIKVWTEEARTWNIFDATDSDNDLTTTADGGANPVSGDANTTANDISCQSLYADAIYGIVWV
jgi:hypothetical protein